MPSRTFGDLLATFPKTYDTITLGPYRFYINPSSYRETSARVIATVQTAGGYGRYDYGNSPTQYIFDGTVGLAGVKGNGGLADLEQLRPQAGRRDVSYPYRYPGRFAGIRYVKVNDFEVSQDNSSPYFYAYHLVLDEYPQRLKPSASTVPTGTIAQPFLPGG